MAQRVRRLTGKHAYLEYGTEIGCAVTNFRGPIVQVVVSLYRGGAFVVFCKRLHQDMETAAVAGSYAFVIGGALAAGVVFAREVSARTENDPRVTGIRAKLAADPANALPNCVTSLLTSSGWSAPRSSGR